jgi:sirohydrochlorin ferrochelatase
MKLRTLLVIPVAVLALSGCSAGEVMDNIDSATGSGSSQAPANAADCGGAASQTALDLHKQTAPEVPAVDTAPITLDELATQLGTCLYMTNSKSLSAGTVPLAGGETATYAYVAPMFAFALTHATTTFPGGVEAAWKATEQYRTNLKPVNGDNDVLVSADGKQAAVRGAKGVMVIYVTPELVDGSDIQISAGALSKLAVFAKGKL